MGRKPSKPKPEQGQRLADLRRAAGLSQYDLAKLVGVTQSSIGYWETCDKPPRANVLPKLAKAFGVSIDVILNEKAEKHHVSEPIKGKARKLFVEISKMPRSQQEKICSIIEPYVKQYQDEQH